MQIIMALIYFVFGDKKKSNFKANSNNIPYEETRLNL